MAKYMSNILFPTKDTTTTTPPSNTTYLFGTLFFGANDSSDSTYANELQKPPQGIDTIEYKLNLLAIINKMKQYTNTIFLISPPPVNNTLWKDRHNDRVQEYTKVCQTIVQENNDLSIKIIHINLYERMMVNTNTNDPTNYYQYLNDGLHFSKEGNQCLANAIIECIEKSESLSSLLPDNLPLDFDIWRDINPDEVEKYFTIEHINKLHSIPAPFRK